MDSMIIDGSHFGGVLRAVDRLMATGYHSKDIELVCHEESELYTLQTTDEKPVIIAVLEY